MAEFHFNFNERIKLVKTLLGEGPSKDNFPNAIENLPIGVKNNLLKAIFQKTFGKVEFFRDFSEKCLNKAALKLEIRHFYPESSAIKV